MAFDFDDDGLPVQSAGGGFDFDDDGMPVVRKTIKPGAEEGGFVASVKQTIGSTIRGAGQAASDFIPGVDQDNPVTRYGQEVIDANPTAVRSLEDIKDKPWTAVKEATGNAGASVAGVVGARALGMGITAASPLAGPAAPVVALAGQAIAWFGPAAIAALPSYGSIREKQILNDPAAEQDAKAKAIATLGAATVGAIETRFGPQEWALSTLTKEGRKALAEKFAETTVAKAIGFGALKGAVIEGGEELVQNPIEQLASFDDPTTPENLKDTAFGGAMGAIGGGVLGGGTGAVVGKTQNQVIAPAQTQPEVKDIGAAQNVDEAILAADAVLSAPLEPAANISERLAPTNEVMQAARSREDLQTFMESESRNLQVARAQMLEDNRRTRELDQIQQAGRQDLGRLPDQQVAAAAAATDEAPTAMQLAMERALARRAQEQPNVSPPIQVPALPPVATGGWDFDATSGLEADVGTGVPDTRTLDTRGTPNQPAGAAVPPGPAGLDQTLTQGTPQNVQVETPLSTQAAKTASTPAAAEQGTVPPARGVEARLEAVGIAEPQKDGTALIRGDVKKILAELKGLGITSVLKRQGGVLVGRSQAKRALQVFKAPAQKVEQQAQPKPVELPAPSARQVAIDAEPAMGERRLGAIREPSGKWVAVDDSGNPIPESPKFDTGPAADNWKRARKTVPAIKGEPIDAEWSAFTPESGTKGVPRAEMPQIKAEHRGAMTNFLNARGIEHEQVEVPARDLKPTQAEFSPSKVEKAKAFEGGDRSILISADNHILDGHHQWLAKHDTGETVQAIRLDAPIEKLLQEVKEFPSAQTAEGATEVQTTPTAKEIDAKADQIMRLFDEMGGGIALTREQVRALIVEKGMDAAEKSVQAFREKIRQDKATQAKLAKMRPATPQEATTAQPEPEAKPEPAQEKPVSQMSAADLLRAAADKMEGKPEKPADKLAEQTTTKTEPVATTPKEEPQEPMFSRAVKAAERDLIVQHNVTAANLVHADRMGGMAAPSVAITKVGQPLHGFGEITLIGDKGLADPKNGLKVFGADIYSPRYPQINYRLDKKSTDKINEILAPFQGDRRKIYPGEIEQIDDLTGNKAFQDYVDSINGKTSRYGDLQAAAKKMLEDVGAEERLFQGFTYSGNRRYAKHTLENVIKILKKDLRGGESFNYGLGSLRAKMTPQFRSIEQIRKAKGSLMDKASFEAVKKEADEELIGISNELGLSLDQTIEVLEDAPKMGVTRAIARAMKDYKRSEAEVDDDIKARVAQFLTHLRNMPAEYFEGKMLRGVGINEFKAAVVPEGTKKEVLSILEKNGLRVFSYKEEDDADRTRAIRQAADETEDALFSRSGQGPGVPMPDAKAVVSIIRKALPKAPQIILHESAEKAPRSLLRVLEENDALNDVEAVYHNGEIHVFPGNIESIERMMFVVGHHEIRHHGLRAMLGPHLNDLMLKLYQNESVKTAAQAKLDSGLVKTRVMAVEEALADMPVEELVKLNGFKKLVAAVRQWLRGFSDRLRAAGFTDLADALEPEQWTDNDIAALVSKAEDVSRSGMERYSTGGTAFSSSAEEISPGVDFWSKIRAGEKFTAKEAEDAWKMGRSGPGRSGRITRLPADRTQYVGAGATAEWSSEGSAFGQYLTLGERTGPDEFAVFVLPAGLVPNPELDVDETESASVVTYVFSKTKTGSYELQILDPKPGGMAEAELQNLGLLRNDVGEDFNGASYSQATIGTKQSRQLLREAVRRLAMHTGEVPSIEFPGRDTGARAGKEGAGRSYSSDQIAAHFSRRAGQDQTDTPAFRKWFGASKVVDAQGKPLVVYHGTTGDFTEFEPGRSGQEKYSDWGRGIYFTPSPSTADYYRGDAAKRIDAESGRLWSLLEDEEKKTTWRNGVPTYTAEHSRLIKAWREARATAEDRAGSVMSVYVSIKNPLVQEYSNMPDPFLADRAKKAGHDGILVLNGNGGLDEIIAFRPEQIKSATGNNGAFDSSNPDTRFSRKQIVGQTNRKHTPQQLRAMHNVGFEVDVPTMKERAQALWQDAGKKLAQGIVDQFAPVKDLDKEAYGLLRLAKGASGAFEVFLHGGKLKLTDGVYDFDDQNKGGVIDKLLIPLQGEHHDFMRWIAANRAERLTAEGRENLFSAQDIADLKTLADGTTDFDYTVQTGPNAGKVTRDRTLIYADAQRIFNAFNKNVLDLAEQSGLIDGDSRHLWEHEFYVPFYRVAEDDGGVRGANIKSGVVRQEAFKKLKGGTQELNADLLDNTLMNWAHLLDAAAKNRAAKATIKAAEKMGAATRVPGGTKKSVWFMDGGEKHHAVVDDPYLLTAITSLEYAGMRNPVMNAMGTFKHYLTMGVTASPFFKIRNLIRDSMQVVATSGISPNVATNVSKGWALTNPQSDEYFRLMAGGGTIHFGTMLEGSEAKRVQALVESGVDDATILNDEHKVKKFYRKVIEPAITAYNELGNRGEAVNRASLYDQLRKQGMSHADASLQARDLMDFSMQGSFTTIRFLTQVVPFLNARLQGLYKLGRAAQEDPKRMAVVLGATALASIALLGAYGDDDDWKKREEWDRNNFFWFKFGGTAFRIPKPFEIGAIATLAERGFELLFDDEMTGKRFRKQVLTLLSDNLSMNPVPQLVKPILDVYANKDSFTGRPIETMGMDRLESEYRFTDRTSMLARGASTAANAVTGLVGMEGPSPVQIDHMLRGYFGWLGAFVVGAGDIVARPMTGQAQRASPDLWKVATGGMIADVDSASSRYVSQMYDQAQEIERAYATWKNLVKEGKTLEAGEYLKEHRDEIVKHRSVSAVKAQETRLNQRIRLIERSNMDPDKKREQIRKIQEQKDRIARRLAN